MINPTIESSNFQAKKGFAFVFLAAFMVVVGVVLLASMPLEIDKKEETVAGTGDHMADIKRALLSYREANNGVLPCPSVLANKAETATDFAVARPAIDCDLEVAIGGVPTKTLSLPDETAFDEYGNAFTYAVDNRGVDSAITIKNANNDDAKGKGGKKIPRYQAVIISHGADGKGAYGKTGARKACSVVNDRVDRSNCAADATQFVMDHESAINDDVLEFIAPSPIGLANCVLWFDASKDHTMRAADGTVASGSVSEWRNLCGNGRNAVAGVAPTLVANSMNGRSVLNFNGTSQYLQIPDFDYKRDNVEIFLVGKWDSSLGANKSYIFSHYDADSEVTDLPDVALGVYLETNLKAEVSKDGTLTVVPTEFLTTATNNAVVAGNAALAHVKFSPQAVAVGANGGTAASTPKAANATIFDSSANLLIGGALNGGNFAGTKAFKGDIAEILMFDKAISTTQKEKVECGLARKWGTVPTSGLLTWLDATDVDANPATPNSAGALSTWVNKTGNASYNAAQATGASQPTLTSAALNGRDALAFNGSQSVDLATAFSGTQFSVLIAYQHDGAFTSANVLSTRVASNMGFGFDTQSQLLRVRAFNASSSSVSSSAASIAYGSPVLAGAVYGASSYAGFLDGVVSSTSNLVMQASTQPMRIGAKTGGSGGANLTGKIGEVLVYDRALSSGERKVTECYLAEKWGITITQ